MKAALLGLLAATAPVLAIAQSPQLDPGRVLAATCANCHGTDGRSSGVSTSLAGLTASQITDRMREFKEGKRPATIMHQLAKGYTDEQIALMAAYFAAQKP